MQLFRQRKFIIIAVALAFAIVALLLAYSTTRNSPPKTPEAFTNHFVKLMSEGNSTESYTLLTDNMKQTFSESIWQEVTKSADESYPGKCSSISITEINDPSDLYKDSDPFRSSCELKIGEKDYVLQLVVLKFSDSFKVDESVLRQK